LSIIHGPFSVAPCQTSALRFQVSGRANTPSWVYRRRLTGRLWNTTSCLTVVPLTHTTIRKLSHTVPTSWLAVRVTTTSVPSEHSDESASPRKPKDVSCSRSPKPAILDVWYLAHSPCKRVCVERGVSGGRSTTHACSRPARRLHLAVCSFSGASLHHASCVVHCIMHHVSYTASCIMCRTLHHASCGVPGSCAARCPVRCPPPPRSRYRTRAAEPPPATNGVSQGIGTGDTTQPTGMVWVRVRLAGIIHLCGASVQRVLQQLFHRRGQVEHNLQAHGSAQSNRRLGFERTE
jgi:hypothetical protein